MQHHHFSITEALKFGWHKTKAHSGVLFQGMLALFAIEIGSSIIDKVLHNTIEGFLATCLLAVVGVIIGAGFVNITLKLAKGEHATYKDLVPKGQLVWYYFCASVVAGALAVLGLILLIIPGIYLLLRFSMVRYAVLEGAGIIESLKQSSTLTEGVKWRLLAFFLAVIGLNILGAIFFLIGLLVTVPVSTIAHAHVYLKLKHRS
jgi:uncharacterized membrane protein